MSDIPEGYRKDARGNLVPIAKIKAQDLLIDDAVTSLVKRAGIMRDELRILRANALDEVGDLQNLIYQEYGARLGGEKGNVTLTSFDGSRQVQVAVQDTIALGPELQAAKSLIDQCLEEWSADTSENLKVLIGEAFQVRKTGRIDTHRVLGLRRLAIEDTTGKWARAMEAISDAVRVQSTTVYVRFYERRGEDGPMEAITLDIAKAG